MGRRVGDEGELDSRRRSIERKVKECAPVYKSLASESFFRLRAVKSKGRQLSSGE